jgi:hypothetical protein
VFSDTFHVTVEEVIEELARRQSGLQGEQWVTRVERSPFGKFLVRSTPASTLNRKYHSTWLGESLVRSFSSAVLPELEVD